MMLSKYLMNICRSLSILLGSKEKAVIKGVKKKKQVNAKNKPGILLVQVFFLFHSWSFSNSFSCHSGELSSIWHKPPSFPQPMKPSLNLQNNTYFLSCSILFCLANRVSTTHSCSRMYSFIKQVLVLIIVAEWGLDLPLPREVKARADAYIFEYENKNKKYLPLLFCSGSW